jgi:hypothetical protein
MFYSTCPGNQSFKTFFLQQNKLACLSVAGILTRAYYFQWRPKSTIKLRPIDWGSHRHLWKIDWTVARTAGLCWWNICCLLPQQNNGKTMVLHTMATHFKYGIQRPPWQRHELSSVISLSFLDVYGGSLQRAQLNRYTKYNSKEKNEWDFNGVKLVICKK